MIFMKKWCLALALCIVPTLAASAQTTTVSSNKTTAPLKQAVTKQQVELATRLNVSIQNMTRDQAQQFLEKTMRQQREEAQKKLNALAKQYHIDPKGKSKKQLFDEIKAAQQLEKEQRRLQKQQQNDEQKKQREAKKQQREASKKPRF